MNTPFNIGHAMWKMKIRAILRDREQYIDSFEAMLSHRAKFVFRARISRERPVRLA